MATAMWMPLSNSTQCGPDCGAGHVCWRAYLRPALEPLVEPLFCAPTGVDLNSLVPCGNELFWLVIGLGVISLLSVCVGTCYGIHRLRVWRRHVQERAGLRQPRNVRRVSVIAPRREGGDLISLGSHRNSVYDPLATVPPMVSIPMNGTGPSTSRGIHIRDDRERV